MPDVAYDAYLGAVQIKQVRRSGFTSGGQILRARASGSPVTSAMFGKMADPKFSFETSDIAGVLAGISLTSGLSVSGGSLVLPYNKRANGGTFAGAGANFELAATDALTVIQQISAQQDGDGAMATLETTLLSADGLSDPVTATGGSTLSSESFNLEFAMGPVTVNGSQVPAIVGFTVTPGLTLLTKRYNGGIFPTQVFIQTIDPTIQITFEDFDALATYGPFFTELSSVVCFLRKRADGGVFVADATAEHIALSMGAGMSVNDNLGADGQNSGQAVLTLQGAVLSSSITSAIA